MTFAIYLLVGIVIISTISFFLGRTFLKKEDLNNFRDTGDFIATIIGLSVVGMFAVFVWPLILIGGIFILAFFFGIKKRNE
jgi:hypothetical protein